MKRCAGHCPKCGTERPAMTACSKCGCEWTLAQERIARLIDRLSDLVGKDGSFEDIGEVGRLISEGLTLVLREQGKTEDEIAAIIAESEARADAKVLALRERMARSGS